MMNYRLTYYGPAGFDYTGFNTLEEVHEYVSNQTKRGLITPVNTMRYSKKKDKYIAIEEWTRVN